MRDLLIVAFLLIAIYYSFKKPYIGVSAWIWVALLAPAEWVFGFSQHFRINLTIVLVTAVSYLVIQKQKHFKFGAIGFWVFLFWLYTLITTLDHMSLNDAVVWNEYSKFSKVIALYFFACLTITKRLHIETVIWAIVLGLSSYAAMEAVKFILSFGNHRITGAAGVIEDRNDLAVAINMAIPLIVYLIGVTKHKYLKLGLLVLLGLNVISIIGTFSRGGFIGLTILAFAFWLRSNYKVISLVAIMITLPTAYSFAPAEWKERQTTISTAASEDSSFIGRLWAWKISTMIAIDNPMTGGGFKSVLDRLVWTSYAPFTPEFGPIDTPEIPVNEPTKAAHNIYFQVLGDHGFVGFTIFMIMGFTAYRTNAKNQKLASNNQVEWVSDLSRYIFLSFIGYGITGLNVSLAYFDLVYILLALITIMSTQRLYEDSTSNKSPNSSVASVQNTTQKTRKFS